MLRFQVLLDSVYSKSWAFELLAIDRRNRQPLKLGSRSTKGIVERTIDSSSVISSSQSVYRVFEGFVADPG